MRTLANKNKMYIYIKIEREREKKNKLNPKFQLLTPGALVLVAAL